MKAAPFRLIALCAVLSCSRAPEGPAERGRSTFVRVCSGCHGVSGKGSTMVGLNQQAPPRDLTDPAFHAAHTDEQLTFVIRNGKGNMPPFAVMLSEEQVRDVVTYVRTLPTPTE